MNAQFMNLMGAVSVTARTFSAADVELIPPFRSIGGPLIYNTTAPNKGFGDAITHINAVIYTTGATAHLIGLMRPLNWTYLTAVIAANGTNLTIKDDPGVYSTNYRYPTATGNIPYTTADNAIAASDFVVLQLKDGSFHASKIASGTFGGGNLVLTTAVPNVIGGGAIVGAPVFFFGVVGDVNPANGKVNPQTTIAASQTRDATWKQDTVGIMAAFNPGDPLLFYTPNTTNNGTLEAIAGYYAKV